MKKITSIYILLLVIILPAAANQTYTADFLTLGTGGTSIRHGKRFYRNSR